MADALIQSNIHESFIVLKTTCSSHQQTQTYNKSC